jgi:hypothetical protein
MIVQDRLCDGGNTIKIRKQIRAIVLLRGKDHVCTLVVAAGQKATARSIILFSARFVGKDTPNSVLLRLSRGTEAPMRNHIGLAIIVHATQFQGRPQRVGPAPKRLTKIGAVP